MVNLLCSTLVDKWNSLQSKPVRLANESQFDGTTLGLFAIGWCSALYLLSNGFLVKVSPFLCFLCYLSAVQYLWCHLIKVSSSTSRRSLKNRATLTYKKYLDNGKSSFPNAVVDWYELLLCWLVLIPMDARFDCTIIHLSWLDWGSALHFFLHSSNQFVVKLSPLFLYYIL